MKSALVAGLLAGGLILTGCTGKPAGPTPSIPINTVSDSTSCTNRVNALGSKGTAIASMLNNANPYDIAGARAAITAAQIFVSEGRQFIADCGQFFPSDKVSALTDALDNEQDSINTARALYYR